MITYLRLLCYTTQRILLVLLSNNTEWKTWINFFKKIIHNCHLLTWFGKEKDRKTKQNMCLFMLVTSYTIIHSTFQNSQGNEIPFEKSRLLIWVLKWTYAAQLKICVVLGGLLSYFFVVYLKLCQITIL